MYVSVVGGELEGEEVMRSRHEYVCVCVCVCVCVGEEVLGIKG